MTVTTPDNFTVPAEMMGEIHDALNTPEHDELRLRIAALISEQTAAQVVEQADEVLTANGWKD